MEKIVCGLSDLEIDIAVTAYSYIYAQRMKGQIERWHGVIKKEKNPIPNSPSLFIRRNALESIGLGISDAKSWEKVIEECKTSLEKTVAEHPLE